MDSVDQFFDFVERGEHALINLNPHFVLVPIYTRIMPLFVHAVYSGDNFYTHILLPHRLAIEIAAAARVSVERSRQLWPARKQNAKFFRTIDISFVEGATECRAVFGADTGAGGSHSAGPRRQGCDCRGADGNRQDTGVFDCCDGKVVRTRACRNRRACPRTDARIGNASGGPARRAEEQTDAARSIGGRWTTGRKAARCHSARCAARRGNSWPS